jgi:hypothetical protein
MGLCAISISQLVLNEIAWSPGDPGTGAPSIFGDRRARPMRCGTTVLPKPHCFPLTLRTWKRRRGLGGAIFSENRLPLFQIML